MNKIFSKFLILLTIIYFNTRSEIKIGLYSGTFDPPTRAHEAIILTSIEKLKLDKLYIFVNKNDEKVYKCSILQRIEMLKCMLKDIKEKVVIIDQSSDNKHQEYLILKKIISEPIILITGQDSYERRLKVEIANRDKFHAIAVIPRVGISKDIILEENAFYLPLTDKEIETIKDVSSTKIREQLAKKDFNNLALNPSVINYIIEHNLYEFRPEMQTLFEHEYYAYLGKYFKKYSLPPFDPQSSVESWKEYFYQYINAQQRKAS
jgi:nicotinic acid mononucleotide adenylyltransferase